eukprot:Sspe_Gene.52238::Locus_28944_Transcript_6_11_Confidence_0.135_Length_701::g.52238::m.52238/K13728/MAD2L2; mitotic spindle assembly checkpoint protein MAD2B
MLADKARQPAPFRVDDTVPQVVEFVQVAVQHILKVRDVYPATLFRQEVKYGVQCWVSRHPDLSEYIRKRVSTLTPLISKHAPHKLAVRVLDDMGCTLQCFVFEVSLRRSVPSLPSRALLHDCFASFLLRIACLDALIPDCTPANWRMEVRTDDATL